MYGVNFWSLLCIENAITTIGLFIVIKLSLYNLVGGHPGQFFSLPLRRISCIPMLAKGHINEHVAWIQALKQCQH